MSNTLLLNVLIQDLISPIEANQKQASELLRLLTQTNVEHRTFVAKHDSAIKALIHIVSQESFDTRQQIALAEHCIAILFHLLMNEDLIYDLGLLGVVKPIAQNVARTARPISMRENAAGALLCLAKLDAHKAPIGIYGGITGLVSLMSSCSERGKQDALKALLHLLVYDGNKALAARGGASRLLLDMSRSYPTSSQSQSNQLPELALSVLKIMASHHEGASAIAAANGVEFIANLIMDMSSISGKEKAALALLRIFKTKPSLAGRLEKERSIHDPTLYSCLNELSIHGSRRGRKAATSLLKLFMDMEVGDHILGHSLEPTKEQDEQDEEDGEELVEAGGQGSMMSSYGELYYGKYPVSSNKEAIVDADGEDDDDDSADDIDDDDEEEECDTTDDDDDFHDDAYSVCSVRSSSCIEVPIMS